MVSGNASSRIKFKQKMAEIRAKAKAAKELKKKGIRGQVKYETRTTDRTQSFQPVGHGPGGRLTKVERIEWLKKKKASQDKAKYATSKNWEGRRHNSYVHKVDSVTGERRSVGMDTSGFLKHKQNWRGHRGHNSYVGVAPPSTKLPKAPWDGVDRLDNYGNSQYNSNPALQGTGVINSKDKKNQWWHSPDFLDNF